MATPMLKGWQAQAMRKLQAEIRAMQKPKVAADGMNLWPRRMLSRKRVMCPIAPQAKRKRKTAQMGTSTLTVGERPSGTPIGREGGTGMGGPNCEGALMMLDRLGSFGDEKGI